MTEYSIILNRQVNKVRISFLLDTSFINTYQTVAGWGAEKSCHFYNKDNEIDIIFHKELKKVSDSSLIKLVKRECSILNKDELPGRIIKGNYKDFYGFTAYSIKDSKEFVCFFGVSQKYSTIFNIDMFVNSKDEDIMENILKSVNFDVLLE